MCKIYCVKYGYPTKPYYGFIKPWNGVRDEETFSLTYIPPSFFDGLKYTFNFKGSIVRHKLTFDLNGMSSEQNVRKVYTKDESKQRTIHTRHELVNPEIVLGFDNKDDAEYMSTQCIFFGQNIYRLCPIAMNDGCGFVTEMTQDEFNNIEGVETFLSDKDDPESFYCGNNRQKGNERMYIKIERNEWQYQNNI